MNLHIFDVSNYVSAGAVADNIISDGVVQRNGRYTACEMACGGVSFLLNTIHDFHSSDNLLVYCADRLPIFKREKFNKLFPYGEGYKGNRKGHKGNTLQQRELAEDVFKRIGVNVMYEDGFEADDIMYSVVRRYKDDFDKIYIHSRDSDARFLVHDNIEVAQVGSSGVSVNEHNFETIPCYGCNIPFNATMVHKLAIGDNLKDNIPCVSPKIGELLMRYLNPRIASAMWDEDLLRAYVSKVTKNDKFCMELLELRLPLTVCPDTTDIDESLSVDIMELMWYGHALGNKYYKYSKPFENPVGDALLKSYLQV